MRLIRPLSLVVAAAATIAAASTAASAASVPAVPDGVTLRVGDQFEYLQTLLGLAGEDDFDYDVTYGSFIGGPPMLQAFQADELDIGFVGSTPLIFAQAGGQAIAAVAGWASPGGAYDLVVAPGVDDIAGWADLEGKRVAFQQGTAGQAALLQGLDSVGLSYDDVTPVNLPQPQVTAALQSGDVDAGLSVEPLTSAYLAANPDGAAVTAADEITDRANFVIATAGALDDEATSAAVADYIARLARSFVYLLDHPGLVADSVYVQTYGLTPERAAEIVAENGTPSFFPLPGEVLDQQQVLADLFHAAGEIPEQIDVSSQFDPRFNDIITSIAGEPAS